VRYIGNKTRLIPFLTDTVEELGIGQGVACDPFAGTASVAKALKGRGWRVHCGDLMALSYAFQVTRVEMDRTPRFRASILGGSVPAHGRGTSVSYSAVLDHLQRSPSRPGFITEHYTPGGRAGRRHGRMYFTPENGAAIDTVRERIADWAAEGEIDRTREQLLLATLIQAADRVANTTGVYASFVKTWQPNAVKTLTLRAMRPTSPKGNGGGCTSFLGPAVDLVRNAGAVDLLYLDPPYNERQYPGYYHVPELVAMGWRPPPTLRGKTGLIPDDDRRSDWCRRGRCGGALRRLLDQADARHVLLSYNNEGLLPAAAIEEILRESGDPDSYRRFAYGYRRYRSDADGPARRYSSDQVRECLHYVRRP
jgi:adenine-specific DNA-methyltransferase